MIDSPYLHKPGKKLDLSKVRANDKGDFKDKEQAEAATAKYVNRLGELQEILYAQAEHAVLIVLQGMDTCGKDGVIEHVFGAVNPQGCQVTSFKVPSTLERSHDYLWRIHNAVPARGMIGIFNRSHYESVLVERVKDLVPKEVWSRRYEQINDFERMLAAERVTILKFFLYISKEEQAKRFQARLDDPTKQWKFNPADLDDRLRWDDYMKAYEDAVQKCSTECAPWFVVPADRKWFRNWVVSDAIVRTMESLKLKYPPAPKGLDNFRIE